MEMLRAASGANKRGGGGMNDLMMDSTFDSGIGGLGKTPQQLEQEVSYLKQVVEDLQQSHGGGSAGAGGGGGGGLAASGQLSWSSPFVRDQRPPGSGRSSSHYGPESPSSPPKGQNSSGGQGGSDPASTSNFFILGSAPISGFDSIIHQQITSSSPADSLAPGSLLQQAHRFAEINSLFSMPEHAEEDLWFKKEFDELNIQSEVSKMKERELQRQKREKLESAVEQHKTRLLKGRSPPRRFPLENKPSNQFSSPRMKIHRIKESTSAPETILDRITTVAFNQALNNSLYNLSVTSDVALGVGEAAMTNPAPTTTVVPLPNSSTRGTGFTAPPSGANTAHGTPSPSKKFAQDSGTPGSSPGKAVPSLSLTATGGGLNTSPTPKPVTMNEDDFNKKTESLGETIRKLVRDTVHQEMVNDCQEHHYTQRAQKKVIRKHEDVLVKRIEKSFGNRVKTMQEELEKLKEAKLIKLQNDQDQWMASQDVTALLGPDASPDDVHMLTQEVKMVVNQALRSHFGRSHGDMGMDEEQTSSRAAASRVHGSINTRSSFNNNVSSYRALSGEHDKEIPTTSATSSAMNNPVEDVIVKPKFKSKAERMLGITTDTKSGLPVNDTAPSAKQGGLFGSLGGLFSSKPGSGNPLEVGRSSKPMSTSMFSTRSDAFSTRSDMAPPPAGGMLSKLHSLDPIIDEESEDRRTPSKASNKSGGMETGPDASASSSKTDGGSAAAAANALQQQISAELSAEEIVYRDLMANLVTLVEVKDNIKKELKDWERDFQKKNGREPTADDKSTISDRFLAYKMACNQVQDAKDQVKASEEKMKEIKARLASS
eukprot:scaffold1131_cov179-Ochromonas_danica.AAC.1